jgi:hypothetical protein
MHLDDAVRATKPCSCGKQMILEIDTTNALLSYPLQMHSNWVCYGCNTSEKGPIVRQRSNEEINEARWREVNNIK